MMQNVMKDGFDTADLKWLLILSDDPTEIARLEVLLEGTQAEAVDEMIEITCWSDDLPHLTGHRGTPLRRLEALRAVYSVVNRPRPETDLSRLSPIEYRLAEALQVTFVHVPDYETEVRALIESAQDAEQAKITGQIADSIEASLIAALNAVLPFVRDSADARLIDSALTFAIRN
jgi:hypothetical protein